MDAALESLQSLKPGEKANYSQTAKKYGVDRSTLSRRHRGVQGTLNERTDNNRFLSIIQETELVRYIKTFCGRALPFSREMVRNFAVEITKKNLVKVGRIVSSHDIASTYLFIYLFFKFIEHMQSETMTLYLLKQ